MRRWLCWGSNWFWTAVGTNPLGSMHHLHQLRIRLLLIPGPGVTEPGTWSSAFPYKCSQISCRGLQRSWDYITELLFILLDEICSPQTVPQGYGQLVRPCQYYKLWSWAHGGKITLPETKLVKSAEKPHSRQPTQENCLLQLVHGHQWGKCLCLLGQTGWCFNNRHKSIVLFSLWPSIFCQGNAYPREGVEFMCTIKQ